MKFTASLALLTGLWVITDHFVASFLVVAAINLYHAQIIDIVKEKDKW